MKFSSSVCFIPIRIGLVWLTFGLWFVFLGSVDWSFDRFVGCLVGRMGGWLQSNWIECCLFVVYLGFIFDFKQPVVFCSVFFSSSSTSSAAANAVAISLTVSLVHNFLINQNSLISCRVFCLVFFVNFFSFLKIMYNCHFDHWSLGLVWSVCRSIVDNNSVAAAGVFVIFLCFVFRLSSDHLFWMLSEFCVCQKRINNNNRQKTTQIWQVCHEGWKEVNATTYVIEQKQFRSYSHNE